MRELNIKLRGIKKSYNRQVLNGIDMDIRNDNYIAIEGKSGTGKSTLMNILGLIENFEEGEYFFNNKRISSGKDYWKIRLNDIGFIFQSYNLIPTMTCRENILLPLMYANVNRSVDVEQLADELGIYDLLETDVNILSGGEKQRIAIARALILDPTFIIADEPTGNLDDENRRVIFEMLRRENNKGRAIVMITHDPSTAAQAKEVYTLSGGILHAKE